MNAPMMTPMIPTKEPPFGKWSPIAAFDFDVLDALEPEVLLAEAPLVAVALATCGDKNDVSDEAKVGDGRHIRMKNLSRLRSCHY